MLQTEHYVCYPGLQRLEPVDPDDLPHPHSDVIRCHLSPIFNPSEMLEAQIATLRSTVYRMLVEVDINEPAPVRYCLKTNWKRFPPSRRRRMKSWRYAPEHTKLHYAPYNGKPWKVRPHPDRYRTSNLGRAVVCQEVKVFALPSADPEPLLKELSNEWCARIAAKLRCRR